jgi:hypothetical protein
MPGLGAVAGRPDPLVGGAHAGVDRDRAAGAQGDAGRLGQPDRRAGAEPEHHQVGVQGPAGGADRPHAVAALDRLHLLLGVQLHPDVADRLADQGAHVRVDAAHHLRSGLHQRGGDAAVDQRLRRLQADVAAADHHRAPGAGVDRPAQVDAVLQDRQAVDPGEVDPGDRRAQRLGAGGDHQHVPGLVAAAVGGEVEPTVARVGGGALPLTELQSFACAVEEELAEPLRLGDPPVVGVVRDARLLLDCRTLTDAEAELVAEAVRRCRSR